MAKIGSCQWKIKRLQRVKQLLQKGWTRGSDAQDANGRRVDPLSRRAVCWCLYGAVLASASDRNSDRNSDRKSAVIVDELEQYIPKNFGSLTGFNDTQVSVQPVIVIIDRAINNLREQLGK